MRAGQYTPPSDGGTPADKEIRRLHNIIRFIQTNEKLSEEYKAPVVAQLLAAHLLATQLAHSLATTCPIH